MSEEHQREEQLFEAARREIAELSDAARESGPEPGEDALVDAFRERVRDNARRGRPSRAPLWIAAAAMLATVSIWAIFLGPEPGPGGTTLGSGDIECLAPRGPVESFDRFEWRSRQTRVRYDLRIYDTDGALVHEEGGLSETTWQPGPALELPPRIVWEVHARDATSAVIGWASAESSLR